MTSAIAGYLTPTAPFPDYDTAFDDFFHDVIVGVTGIPNELVRPRWQMNPPTIPNFDTDWVGFGAGDAEADAFAYEAVGTVIRHEIVPIICSFYGPNASGLAALLRDGLALSQNRFALDMNSVGIVEAIGPRSFGELVKEQMIRRSDLRLIVKRQIRREYRILSVLSAHGDVHTGNPALDFSFEAGVGTPPVSQLDYSDPDGGIYAMAVGV